MHAHVCASSQCHTHIYIPQYICACVCLLTVSYTHLHTPIHMRMCVPLHSVIHTSTYPNTYAHVCASSQCHTHIYILQYTCACVCLLTMSYTHLHTPIHMRTLSQISEACACTYQLSPFMAMIKSTSGRRACTHLCMYIYIYACVCASNTCRCLSICVHAYADALFKCLNVFVMHHVDFYLYPPSTNTCMTLQSHSCLGHLCPHGDWSTEVR